MCTNWKEDAAPFSGICSFNTHTDIMSFDPNWKNFVFIALGDHQMLKRVWAD